MQHVQSGLRHAWTQFDLPLMVLGLLSLVECLLYNIRLSSVALMLVLTDHSHPCHSHFTYLSLFSAEPSSLTQWIVRSGTVFLQLSTYFGGDLIDPLICCLGPTSSPVILEVLCASGLTSHCSGSENPAVPMLQFTLSILVLYHIAHIVGRMMAVDKINANTVRSSHYALLHC